MVPLPIENNLRDIRYDLKKSQVDFAQHLGIGIYQYNRYEKQKVQPSLEIALKISEKVGLSVNEIFKLTPE
ncbi:helix-turn-helix transcriptional regulator [Bacillus sp. LL01]|uniref:helix-turn-helix transcriptional regulator n=1 Tax=Bacillus sp. LL01 TaxID=1665556 RepID=UPI001F5250A9|nr:helix-turn-helix transcriptional regulator [Bacillus sp. LL01]